MEDVGVDLRGGDVGVSEQFLEGAQIGARFEQMGGETVPEGVAADFFDEVRRADGGTERFLDGGLVEVMAADGSGGVAWVATE